MNGMRENGSMINMRAGGFIVILKKGLSIRGIGGLGGDMGRGLTGWKGALI